jgi:hypothetical protein
MIKSPMSLISVIASIFVVNLIYNNSVWAKPITYDFTVNVVEGPLQGQNFSGFFSYDDEQLTGKEREIIGVQDGLKVCMNFMEMQDETQDIDYPEFPQLTFQQGKPETLDFWVESSPRQLWWNRNGWLVEISPRQDSTLVSSCNE